MKKCPYCAEDIQDAATLCRWCHKKVRTTNLSLSNIFRQLSIVLVVIALVSFFIPFVKFQLPMMGSQSFSAAGVLQQIVQTSDQNKQKRSDGKFSIDVRSLQRMMQSDEGIRVSRSKVAYSFIPLGLICGVVAYILIVPIAVSLWLKRSKWVRDLSGGAFLLSWPLMASLWLLNDLLQTTINLSIGQLRNNPFADLASTFMQGVRIEPGIAVYLLLATTFFISLINWDKLYFGRRQKSPSE